MASKYILVCLIIFLWNMDAVCCADTEDIKNTITFKQAVHTWDAYNCTFPDKYLYSMATFGLDIPTLEACHTLERQGTFDKFKFELCQTFFSLSIELCKESKYRTFVKYCLNPTVLKELTVFDDNIPGTDVCTYASSIMNFPVLNNITECRENCGDSDGSMKGVCELFATVYYQHSSQCLHSAVEKLKLEKALASAAQKNTSMSVASDTDKIEPAELTSPVGGVDTTTSQILIKSSQADTEPAPTVDDVKKSGLPIQINPPLNRIKIASVAEDELKSTSYVPIQETTNSESIFSTTMKKLLQPVSIPNTETPKSPLDAETTKSIIETSLPYSATKSSDLEFDKSIPSDGNVQISASLYPKKTTQDAKVEPSTTTTTTGDDITPEHIEDDNPVYEDNSQENEPEKSDRPVDEAEKDSSNPETQIDGEEDSENNLNNIGTKKDAGSDRNKNTPPEGQKKTHKEDIDEPLENEKDGEQLQGAAKEKGRGEPHSFIENDEEPSSGHFLAYFLTAVVICISGYIIYHNKQKILAFVIEGRNNGRGGRQRSKEVKYTQLKSNVEEVLPSLEQGATSKNFVY
uniref:MANSC domain-containing protein n=1 Tax=Arion vulgaris TaxID=1028688 RepID=A0A0B7AQQ0_9EUPU